MSLLYSPKQKRMMLLHIKIDYYLLFKSLQ